MKILLLFILNSIYIEAGNAKNHKENLFHPAIARDKEKSKNKTESIVALGSKLTSLEEERKNLIKSQKNDRETSERLKTIKSEIKTLKSRLKK